MPPKKHNGATNIMIPGPIPKVPPPPPMPAEIPLSSADQPFFPTAEHGRERATSRSELSHKRKRSVVEPDPPTRASPGFLEKQGIAKPSRRRTVHAPSPENDSMEWTGESDSDHDSGPPHKVNGPPFVCPVDDCQHQFSRRGDFTRHVDSHYGIKRFICPVKACGRLFSQNSALKTHLNIHTGLKPHKCDICLQGFGDPSSRTRHRKEKHTHPSPYWCPFDDGCNFKNKRRANFREHLHREHGLELPKDYDYEKFSSERQPEHSAEFISELLSRIPQPQTTDGKVKPAKRPRMSKPHVRKAKTIRDHDMADHTPTLSYVNVSYQEGKLASNTPSNLFQVHSGFSNLSELGMMQSVKAPAHTSPERVGYPIEMAPTSSSSEFFRELPFPSRDIFLAPQVATPTLSYHYPQPTSSYSFTNSQYHYMHDIPAATGMRMAAPIAIPHQSPSLNELEMGLESPFANQTSSHGPFVSDELWKAYQGYEGAPGAHPLPRLNR